jgi:ABC-type sugar transport system substrate-binding protein
MRKGLFSVLLVPILVTACGVPAENPAHPTGIVCVCKCAVSCPQGALELTPGITESMPGTPRPTAARKVWTYEDMAVGFIPGHSEGKWRAANYVSFEETAQELGIKLTFYDPTTKITSQLQHWALHHFVADEEIDVIVLSALERTGWEDVLREAKAAGKIVILEDRRVDAPEELYTTYVGSDCVEQGRRAADEMCRLLEGSEKRNVWELVGNLVSDAAKDRGKGFRERMYQCGIELTMSQTANWDAAEGKTVTEARLRETQDVQGIFAQNDEMALGAIEAIKEAGLKPGIDIKIVSVDATGGAFEAMLAGELNVSVECSPDIAPQVYEAALKALNGEELPKWMPTREGVFSSDMPNLEKIAENRNY